jgi:RNA polymerase sigma factor (sigma-70 family)
MAAEPPNELSRLLETTGKTGDPEAWEAFVQKYSRLLMHVSRSLGDGYDGAMDRYARMLEQLRSDDFRRLRTYAAHPQTKFTTWLVVVARRICMDHQRGRYGRQRITGNPHVAQKEEFTIRRKLADLVVADVDPDALGDSTEPDAARRIQQAELHEALDKALRQLPNRDRLLISLRFEDDAPVREIAEVMGFPSQFHVYRRLKKGLTELRRTLQSRGIDEPNV